MEFTVQQQLDDAPKVLVKKLLIVFTVVLLIVWAAWGISFQGLNQKGIQVAQRLLESFLHPNMEILFGDSAYGVRVLGLETIAIAFLGTIAGAFIAIPIAFLAARNIAPRFVNIFFQGTITGIRVFPVFVIGVAVIKITGFGPFAGVLTMGFTSIGMMTKLYVESVEGINKNVLDALDATGCNSMQKIRFGIIPQLTAKFLSTAIYRFEINLKNAAVLGLVGAGGIGGPLLNAIKGGRFEDASSYLIGLAVMVLLVEFFSNKIRNKLS